MMYTIVGKEGFRKGMDLYFKEYDGKAVTILDFAKSIAEPNQVDFTQFKLWYSQSELPKLQLSKTTMRIRKVIYFTLKSSIANCTEKEPKRSISYSSDWFT